MEPRSLEGQPMFLTMESLLHPHGFFLAQQNGAGGELGDRKAIRPGNLKERKRLGCSRLRWSTPIIPALGRLRQEDCEFLSRLAMWLVKSCFETCYGITMIGSHSALRVGMHT